MQRRRLFRSLTRGAAALAWQQVFGLAAQAQAPEADRWVAPSEVFTLGVASGEPRPDSVVLWTRLAPQPLKVDGGMPGSAVPVRWQVALDERFQRVVREGAVSAQPAAAHAVHVEVEGLAAGQTYHYRFEAAGQHSPVGRTRTAPAPDARPARLRMALSSCQHYEAGLFVAHREMAASDIDLVLFVGDYTYETEAQAFLRVRKHPHVFPDDELAYTLEDYRQHHAAYKLDADLQANHAAHPWLLVWDDHEVLNGYTGDVAPDVPDPTQFLRLRTMAYRAYFEHMPVSPRRAPNGPLMRMHDQYRWGQLADLWTVDGRQFRDGPVCHGWHAPANGGAIWDCAAAEAPQRTLLGTAQADWLAAGLASSDADWKFIVGPSQISPGLVRSPWGPLAYADGWDAFPAARRRLMNAIAQPRVPDVVCLGGDVHRHVAANLRLDPQDPKSPIVASEFVGTSVTSKGMSELLTSWMKASNPDLLHLRSDERGYLRLEVTPEQVLAEFRGTPHPVRAGAQLHTQARYVVRRGEPGPRKV
jgi:alkaline phosphatase D